MNIEAQLAAQSIICVRIMSLMETIDHVRAQLCTSPLKSFTRQIAPPFRVVLDEFLDLSSPWSGESGGNEIVDKWKDVNDAAEWMADIKHRLHQLRKRRWI